MEPEPTVAGYRFENFVLDLRRGSLLTTAGEQVPLRRQSFELLRLLVENAGRLLDRDTINRAIWSDVVVTDDSITQCVRDIRRALRDETQRILKTVPRRGYLMAAEVAAACDQMGQPVTAALPGKPSIAVLPFANLSGDPGQEYFADGMAEEIITALSRIRWLSVVARNSSFTYKTQAIDVKRVGRELDVRYVLEGSVRHGAGRVRITTQLIEAETATHLWADRFDGPLDEVFELQDQVAIAVAGVIEPTLQAAEIVRSASRPTHDLTAYDAYLRACAMLFGSGEIPQALAVLEEAIVRDPDYGPALALAAICSFRLCADGTSEHPEADRRKGMDFGHRALRTARDDPATLANAAFALGWFGEDIDAMIAVMDRALRLNPSHARGWYISGTLHLFAGEPEIAIEHLETALRLSPRARLGTVHLHIGMAHLVSRHFDAALSQLLLDIQDVEPNNPGPFRYLAACYAHMGRLDDARDAIARLLAITPLVFEDLSYLRNPEHREMVLSGLRIATTEAGAPHRKRARTGGPASQAVR